MIEVCKRLGCCSLFGVIRTTLGISLVFDDDCRQHMTAGKHGPEGEELLESWFKPLSPQEFEYWLIDTNEFSFHVYQWYLDEERCDDRDALIERYLDRLSAEPGG